MTNQRQLNVNKKKKQHKTNSSQHPLSSPPSSLLLLLFFKSQTHDTHPSLPLTSLPLSRLFTSHRQEGRGLVVQGLRPPPHHPSLSPSQSFILKKTTQNPSMGPLVGETGKFGEWGIQQYLGFCVKDYLQKLKRRGRKGGGADGER